jgi:hypothetical protein
MRILYFGDVVGRSGREAVIARAPELRERLKIDFMMACGENAASGFGITAKICTAFYAAGIDCITLGNHAWDQREIIGYIDGDPKLLRPANYPTGTPGRGLGVFDATAGRKVMVIQVMTRLFMDPLDDPFPVLDEALRRHRLGHAADAIVVDLHGEATSEKMALGHHVDGRASMAVGTHTHVPTADALIMPGGTAYQSDIGMCGDYDSVIGMKKEIAVPRFTRKMPGERLAPADGEATVCAVFVETDDRTGLATKIAPVRLGGRLSEAMPSL